jgi:hypothetical protein
MARRKRYAEGGSVDATPAAASISTGGTGSYGGGVDDVNADEVVDTTGRVIGKVRKKNVYGGYGGSKGFGTASYRKGGKVISTTKWRG